MRGQMRHRCQMHVLHPHSQPKPTALRSVQDAEQTCGEPHSIRTWLQCLRQGLEAAALDLHVVSPFPESDFTSGEFSTLPCYLHFLSRNFRDLENF